jgi:F-type H+-transporting ATPase subunit b
VSHVNNESNVSSARKARPRTDCRLSTVGSSGGWRFRIRYLLFALCLPFCLLGEPVAQAAAPEAAGAHGEAHLDPRTFAFQLINFGILVAILGYFGGRAINRALLARHDQLKRDLQEAVQARAAAEARLLLQERRLTNLASEVTALRASIKEEALAEEKRLLQAVEEKARRIQDETRFLMDQEIKQAEIRFREEVAAEAIRIAEEVVLRSVRPEDETRLGQIFIADLAGGGGNKVASGRGGGGNGEETVVTGLGAGEEAHS